MNIQEKAHDIIQDAILDGQNQIYDLLSDRATAYEINTRMENTYKYCADRMDKVLESLAQTIRIETIEEVEKCVAPKGMNSKANDEAQYWILGYEKAREETLANIEKYKKSITESV